MRVYTSYLPEYTKYAVVAWANDNDVLVEFFEAEPSPREVIEVAARLRTDLSVS